MARPRRFSYDQFLEIVRLITIDKKSDTDIALEMHCSRATIYDLRHRKNYQDYWDQYDTKPTATATTDLPQDRVGQFEGNRFVFVCAQNNTYVHDKFFRSLKQFVEIKDAQLIVGRSHYNKNGFQNMTDDNEDQDSWFDSKIRDHIIDRPMKITDDLVWHGELDILPTAARPLNGLHNYVMDKSAIIPHVKCAMDSLPAHVTDETRFLYTSMAITMPNYIQKKTGQKAEFHHVIGALYVEVDDDGVWYARQLHADSKTGEFYDLNEYYTPDGVEIRTGEAVAGINWGDLHVEHMDPSVAMASFGIDIVKKEGEYHYENVENQNNMLDFLKPKTTFCHDTSDFAPRNHHNISDPHFRFAQHNGESDNVEASLKQCADLLAAISRENCETVVVQSNHDLAFMKWLKTADYKTDPENARFFLESQLRIYQAIENKDKDFNIFADVLRDLNSDLHLRDVTFLKESDPYMLLGVGGIQCGYHGHNGPGGSRGSTIGYTKLGYRVNIGHQHSASICEGVYVAGVCTRRDLDYAKGSPSSWSNSHIVTYANGKRTIITVKNGKWRASKNKFTTRQPVPDGDKIYFRVEGGERHGLTGSYEVPENCIIDGEIDNQKVIKYLRNKLQYMGPTGFIQYGEK